MEPEDGRRTAAQYDAMGADYGDYNEVNAANAHYERPATIALLGQVSGRDVLEIGCGAGTLTTWLVDEGARVVAFDVAARMVAITQEKVGDRASVSVGDLHDGLPQIETASQDVIVASLVVHYLKDWEQIFAEFRRVIRDDGVVVFSTHHPAWDWLDHSPDDYFAKLQVTETWTRAGKPFDVTFWRRPLREITQPIRAAGFVIDVLTEAEPLPDLAERDPEADHELKTRPFFLHFRLRVRPSEWDES